MGLDDAWLENTRLIEKERSRCQHKALGAAGQDRKDGIWRCIHPAGAEVHDCIFGTINIQRESGVERDGSWNKHTCIGMGFLLACIRQHGNRASLRRRARDDDLVLGSTVRDGSAWLAAGNGFSY